MDQRLLVFASTSTKVEGEDLQYDEGYGGCPSHKRLSFAGLVFLITDCLRRKSRSTAENRTLPMKSWE
jgi:hypothetical protein